ncbi:MAG: hypothetical protein CM1200mP24_04610 [Gammaproteobacteria bacterium]|nr:MAG: hypothetical protein CM1200mP24_04610 [Gammaproteobacteria bacterium]
MTFITSQNGRGLLLDFRERFLVLGYLRYPSLLAEITDLLFLEIENR